MNTDMRTITVGIDGSRPSLDAADWAAREAQRRRLPLRLLHAGTEGAVRGRVPDADVPAGRTRTELDRAAIRLSYAHPALDIIARRTATPAVPALLAAAIEAQTLVLGSRGRTGSAGFPVGSVALGVSARAERPVVLVRAGELPEDERMPVVDGSPPSTAPYLPVVLGLDPDAAADDLIGYAFDTAAVRSAPLHVVHSATVPVGTLQSWRHTFPATRVREHRVDGEIGPRLLEASARAGLLVVGRRTGRGPGRAARSLIRHAGCPVAVVPLD
ncbi:universal stress protein [Streptomyces sp. NBC_01728]|uniref:universal stress protein n=1 Tax=unclassified Streptomyces TaxID=2593676 RepID=UPI00224EA48D|nr:MULTISPECIES: universal stress protein [unclassified Streptomyces]MCX4459173.1 universal stress protein [Streptomyces sp. NBC_01719]MCX4498530.1 universal stress protein [Streptomyces sp. NBC_01728]MCX4595556.1 universal stress protein [Streptomyces sp. NBC_01549]